METDVMAILPATFLAFGPGGGDGAGEPDEPKEDKKSETDTPKREDAPERDKESAHPHRHEEGKHVH